MRAADSRPHSVYPGESMLTRVPICTGALVWHKWVVEYHSEPAIGTFRQLSIIRNARNNRSNRIARIHVLNGRASTGKPDAR